ncbi:acyl-CoA carboxylase subunit epsilon [Streptomyces sp. NPDC003247]|uniref:acyl-CoA carboxylase subunit epsilon n=1 Tax=Streptomyces sp. NPDC003247 TaxID=3364677 RepID=UPI00367BBDC0
MPTPDIRVEKGRAGPEEVAAVMAVLLARAVARPTAAPARRGRVTARWRRLEREGGFRAPHSWRGR